MGQNSDDLLTNSMASSNSGNILEKGRILSFGSWIYIADGSGGFTSNLVNSENVERSLLNEALSQDNSAAPVADLESPPEDPGRKKNSI